MKTQRSLFYAFYALNVAFIIGVWYMTSSYLLNVGSLSSQLLFLARIAGLLGMFALLMQFVLIGRAPIVERAFGLDRLTRIHHWNGITAFTLILAHVLTILLSKLVVSDYTVPEQFREIFRIHPYTFLAFIAVCLLCLTVGLSITMVRRRLPYELWHYIHLGNYLVVALVFWHQISNGLELITYQWFRLYWVELYIFVLGQFVVFRILRPLYFYAVHRFYVKQVVPEANGVVSLVIGGKQLDRFKYQAGQFAKWWFVAPGYRWEMHPFTISIEPGRGFLRLTPKGVGDFTKKLPDIKVGTPVVVDGPYGVFTAALAGNNPKLLLIAGGIGITPLRAIVGAKATADADMQLLYSARTEGDLALRGELTKISGSRKLRVTYVLSDEQKPGYRYGRVDSKMIEELVPDFKQRDIYICGPPSMMYAIKDQLLKSGVKSARIHTEEFSL